MPIVGWEVRVSKTAIALKDIHVDGYERVIEIKHDLLHAVIAIHDTRLGPALGGIRAYPYASFADGLQDALRLAKAMTYKAAVAETGTGGGKSVIFADSRAPKTEKLLYDFASVVNELQGSYICAEDLGVGLQDVAKIRERTPYAVGLPHPKSSGDPSRFTAYGGFKGIQAVCHTLWGRDEVEGKTFAIQGLGSVGMRLAQHIFWQGGRLIVTDTNRALVTHAVAEYGAQAVAPDEIYEATCDIFVPCALGGILHAHSIPKLRCQAVAGVANNQLLSSADGDLLYQLGILYAPDFVINSAGLLAVCLEIEPEGFDPAIARQHADRIYDLLKKMFATSAITRTPPHQIAQDVAERNLADGIGKRTIKPVFH
jgi:leucine dehydrogenase